MGKKYNYLIPPFISVVFAVLLGLILHQVGAKLSENIIASVFAAFLLNLTYNVYGLKSSRQDISRIKSKIDQTDSFVTDLLTNRSRIDKIQNSLAKKKGTLKEFSLDLFNDYLQGFEVRDSGVYVKGEEIAVETAKAFWSRISNLQNQSPEIERVVRVVHSNDISIWLPENQNNGKTSELLTPQQSFIKKGGKVYRILVGEKDEPDDDYKEAMKVMKDHGIKVRYVCKKFVTSSKFDFLHYDMDNFVLAWQSEGTNSTDISGFILSDGCTLKGVFSRWQHLFTHLENNGNPFSIPDHLQKRMDDLMKECEDNIPC